MTWFGAMLLLVGALVIAAPLGWIAVTKMQSRSDRHYKSQQDRLEQRYRKGPASGGN